MVNIQKLDDSPITLTSDIAGEFPVYVYINDDKECLLYSKNIVDLLDDDRVEKPLRISNEGLSFLLQSGVVPPPKSIYENVYILEIGNSLEVKTLNNKLDLKFDYNFPFYNKNRLKKQETKPDEDKILELIAKATIDRMDTSKESFLFHSAGKDSNSIAVSLAEAGWQDKITLVTHKSKGNSDESEISKSIANKLGFKHRVLKEVDSLQTKDKEVVDDYFKNMPFPCVDKVTLAYPLYLNQMPELSNSNLVDGSGNDVYIGHIPSLKEINRQKVSTFLKYSRKLSKEFKSESLFNVSGKMRSEWTGLSGMSYADVKQILKNSFDVHSYWKRRDSNIDYLDFRADIRGTVIDQEMFIRKIRNFSDTINSNLILPFTNSEVANYFATIPEEYLFDRRLLKNKLVLRKILKDRIDLDSDKLGKMAFSYDTHTLIIENWDLISSEILSCKIWNQKEISKLLKRMKDSTKGNSWSAGASGRLLYRLYLISGWLNKNRWL